MKQLLVIVSVIVVLAAAWFLASPLFIDKTVDESFDFVLDDGRLNMQQVMAMPTDERRAMMPEIMRTAANAPDRQAGEPMPSNAPQAIARGRFVDADAIHKGSGSATLYELPNGQHLVRFQDLQTTNGPALVVYLARHAAPAAASDVSDNGFLSLGELKGNIGNQNYAVPVGTDISDYNSVVIWCELFGVLFSPAALNRL